MLEAARAGLRPPGLSSGTPMPRFQAALGMASPAKLNGASRKEANRAASRKRTSFFMNFPPEALAAVLWFNSSRKTIFYIRLAGIQVVFQLRQQRTRESCNRSGDLDVSEPKTWWRSPSRHRENHDQLVTGTHSARHCDLLHGFGLGPGVLSGGQTSVHLCAAGDWVFCMFARVQRRQPRNAGVARGRGAYSRGFPAAVVRVARAAQDVESLRRHLGHLFRVSH